jgi:hypothetical protein
LGSPLIYAAGGRVLLVYFSHSALCLEENPRPENPLEFNRDFAGCINILIKQLEMFFSGGLLIFCFN